MVGLTAEKGLFMPIQPCLDGPCTLPLVDGEKQKLPALEGLVSICKCLPRWLLPREVPRSDGHSTVLSM